MVSDSKAEFDVLLVAYEHEENLGIRSIAAYLLDSGVRTRIASIDASSEGRILRLVESGRPKIVGFSLIFQRMLPEFSELMKFLRMKGVNAHFTVGGHFPTIEPEVLLGLVPELDTVVRHEGEETLLELYRKLDDENEWPSIKGIAYRQDGSPMMTPPRPLISDLDAIPVPLRRHKLDTHRGIGICTITASRGCRHNCSFCSVREFYRGAPGPRRRSRSPSGVVHEMVALYRRGTRVFLFKDDDLGCGTPVQRKWLEDFVRELELSGLAEDILWKISCRPDEIDADLFAELKDAGLGFVYMGVESGSARGLMTGNKTFEVEDVFRALRVLRKLELRYEYGFMLFDPDSTLASIDESISFLGKAFGDGRSVVHYTKMLPYAGTQIARRLRREGRLKGTTASPDYDFTDLRVGLLETFLSQTFFDAFFGDSGLVKKLQASAFDSAVVERFLSSRYVAREYTRAVREQTRRFNESSLETTKLACDFVADRSYDDVLDGWWALDFLQQQELDAQKCLEHEVDALVPESSSTN